MADGAQYTANVVAQPGVVVAVVGPTASGKSSLAIALAQALGTEIVNADARQVYRGMAIGTAQPTAEERREAVHHLVDFLDPTELYSAGRFEDDAVPRLATLCHERGTAILAGGSGMYVRAALEGLDPLPADLAIRRSLNEALAAKGLPALVEQLRTLDPEHARGMDVQNPQRVVRALEVCLASGKPFSSFHNHTAKPRPWHLVRVGLRPERSWMRARIAQRAKTMMDQGWLEEARALSHLKDANALNTVGYKELFRHLRGECTLERAMEDLVTHTQQFAKRQLTWFQRDVGTTWFDLGQGTSHDVKNACIAHVRSEVLRLQGTPLPEATNTEHA